MKTKTIFFWLFGIWSIDLILTFIALNLLNGFYEVNKISAFFFSFGWYGWITHIFLACLFFFVYSFGINKSYSWSLEKWGKKPLISFIPLSGIITFFILESFVIINNLKLILR